MINWKKYDPYSRSIESHVPHLVTNGKQFMVAVHQRIIGGSGYEWVHANTGYRINNVTYWSPVKLPAGDKA
ncbi:hypothetical protein J43TS9_51340 [Paenibacillus cineris]|nr:hypothetical protein J43TS9_51340 [Paenibacillus cineris]